MGAKDLIEWLKEAVRLGGSDLYLTAAARPTVRTPAGLVPLDTDVLDAQSLSALVADLTTPEQQAAFASAREFNMSLDLGRRLGRFRVNMLQQRGQPAIVIRRISAEVPTMEGLGLPPLLGDLARERRGLVVVVGGTGSGKSTTLAAMVDWRNRHEAGHILTIEDPLEYVHEHKMSLVTQREVGTDTRSFDDALKNALRQRPDAILIGEIRDREVMRHALNIAETGHLALATLHANNADQAIDRIANFFDPEERRQALLNLSFNLRGILSQRLVRTVDGGRALALEVLLNRGGVVPMVRSGDTSAIKPLMQQGEAEGMRTFDRSIQALLREGRISREVALAEADDRAWMEENA